MKYNSVTYTLTLCNKKCGKQKKTFKSLHKELFLLQMLYALKKNKNKDVQNRYPKRITGDKSTLGCGN